MSMKFITLLLTISLMSLTFPVNAGDGYDTPGMQGTRPASSARGSVGETYGQTVGRKLGSGFSNIALGWVEVPKNVISTSNDLNPIAGFTLGIIKGAMHAGARTVTGITDLLTAPVPTKPIVEPDYVWQNFSTDTHYGPVFQLTE